MLEIGPGVYTVPSMNPSVRQRIWSVCAEWFEELQEESSIVMTWADKQKPGGQGILSLGCPPRILINHEGMILSSMKHTRQ